MPAVDDLLLGFLLYQSRLVPRVLPLIGIHRSGPARRWRHRRVVRSFGQHVRGGVARRTPDRAI